VTDTYKLTCLKCGRSMTLEQGPLKRPDTTIDECALCDEERNAVCYCSDFQSSGLPCLPGKCPNVPGKDWREGATRKQRIELNEPVDAPCECGDYKCSHSGTCGARPAFDFMLEGWPDSITLCDACKAEPIDIPIKPSLPRGGDAPGKESRRSDGSDLRAHENGRQGGHGVDPPQPITFRDENGEHRELIVGVDIPRSQAEFWRHATPEDLSRAGFAAGALHEVIEHHFAGRFALGSTYESVLADVARELEALRAFERYAAERIFMYDWRGDAETTALLKAIDEARKP
jgi:hypothetical protein